MREEGIAEEKDSSIINSQSPAQRSEIHDPRFLMKKELQNNTEICMFAENS